MDSQPTFPNSQPSGERPQGVRPEDLHADKPDLVGVEAAPAPANGPGGGDPAQSPMVPPALTRDEAAAAAGITAAQPQMPLVQGPATAADVDVIEPEWVNKAEEVVRQTQGDPYQEEEAIEDLQQDYLLKRYGHKVADPKAGDSKPEAK